MKYAYVLFIALISAQVSSAQILSPEIQIKTALLAAPEEMRAGAMVYGYNAKVN